LKLKPWKKKLKSIVTNLFLGSGFIVHKIVTNYAFFEILSIVLNNKITN